MQLLVAENINRIKISDITHITFLSTGSGHHYFYLKYQCDITIIDSRKIN
jgi:hypothetical protein